MKAAKRKSNSQKLIRGIRLARLRLAKAEQHTMALRRVTESDPIESTAQVIRVPWSALAYGDEDTFRRIGSFANEWLSRNR